MKDISHLDHSILSLQAVRRCVGGSLIHNCLFQPYQGTWLCSSFIWDKKENEKLKAKKFLQVVIQNEKENNKKDGKHKTAYILGLIDGKTLRKVLFLKNKFFFFHFG